MNIRAIGRLLFSGFGLPKQAFRESSFLPDPKPKSLFESIRLTFSSLGVLVLVGFFVAGALSASANNGAFVGPPQNVQATGGPLNVTITWSVPIRLDGRAVTGYEVAYSTGGRPNDAWTSQTVASNATSYKFSGLPGTTTYYTRVRALVSGGQGAWGYPWTSAYRTTNFTRDLSGAFTYASQPADFSRSDFTRVRYRITASSSQFSGTFVDADFHKDFTQQSGSNAYSNQGYLRVPDMSNVFTLQGDVSDLTVSSDSSGVSNGQGLTGRIEIWARDYSTTGGNWSLYDNIDTQNAGGNYGSFQLHSATPNTIFAWNRHGASGELGFGSRSISHPDWTFADNSWSISNFSFESYANLPVTTTKSSQTITFGTLTNRTLGTGTFSLSATASSGLTVAFSSGTTGICTVSGTTVTLLAAGTCTIRADQAGNTDYNAAIQGSRSFTVSPAISITTPSSGLSGTFNSAYSLTISASGGATPTTFSLVSGTLPSGLSLNTSTGVISGTPTNVENRAVQVRVTDANSATATTSSFTISIATAPLSTPSTPTVSATVGTLKSLGVLWSAVANASSYEVRIYASNGSTLLQTISNVSETFLTVNSSNFASIGDGVGYRITVVAVGAGNFSSSAQSAQSSATTNSLVTFEPNGGAESAATQVVPTGTPVSLNTNRFTRDRYSFRGWNTLANGTGTDFANSQSITQSGNLTLYALWTSLDDRAWDKGNEDGEYAFLNDSANPVIPISATAAWTIETWVRPDTIANSWSALFAQQGDANIVNTTRNAIWLDSGQIVLVTPGASSDIYTGIFLQANRWTHIAWVMTSSTNSQLYFDGQLVWSGTMSRGNTGGTHFAIGGSRQTGHPEFDGHIDQVKVWGTNLSSAQVARSMHEHSTWTGTSASPGVTCALGGTGLRAHYDFNEFNTGVVLDRSSCGRHLAFNTNPASDFTSSAIVSNPTSAHSLQTFVQFNRSYLTAAGGWTPPQNTVPFKALIVGGGGGGAKPGTNVTGGAAAGGAVYTIANIALPPSAVPIVVGQGGLANNSATGRGSRGGDSRIGDLLVAGGEGGIGSGFTSASRLTATGGSTYIAGANGAGGRQGGWTDTSNASTLGTTGGAAADQTYNGQTFVSMVGVTGSDKNADPGTGGTGGQSTLRTSAITGASVEYGKRGEFREFSAGAQTIGSGGENKYVGGTTGTPTNGMAGVVVLSYGATMEVTQSQGVARVGANFQRPIIVQLKNENGNPYTGADVQVTLSAASSSVLRQTINGVTTDITSTTTTSRNGLATFSNIGFQSGVNGVRTLTITSDAFVGITLSVTPTFTASTINITASGETDGTFINGVFESNTPDSANIRNSNLETAMASGNVLVESTGPINIQANVVSNTSGAGVTFKANSNVIVSNSVQITTSNGNVVFWSRAAATNNPASQATEGRIEVGNNVTVSSNGGAIVLAGSASVDVNRLPNGAAFTNAGTGTRFAISLGTDQANGGNVQLLSGGGDIRIFAQTGSGALQALAGRISSSSKLTIDSGSGRQDWNIVGGNSADNTFEVWNGSLDVISSASDAVTPAINFYARNTGNGYPVIQQTGNGTSKLIVTGSGDLNVDVSTTGAGLAIDDFERIQYLANGGDITLNFGSTGVDESTSTATSSNPVIIGAVSGQSTTSNVTVLGGKFGASGTANDGGGAGGIVVRTNGAVKVEPSSGSFTEAQVFDRTWSFMGNSALTLGKTGNTGNITVSGTNSVAGNLNIIGGNVTVSGAQTTTSGGNITITPSGTYAGAGALTSAGTLTISGGSTVGPQAAIQTVGNATFSGSGNFTNSGANITSSTGNVSITTSGSATAVVSANVQATAGSITFNTGGSYSGSGTLTAGTAVAVTSAGVTIGGNVLAAGNATYTSTGSLIQNANVTSSTGNVTMTISGASANYTKSTTSTITASQEVSISSAASTVNTTGTGTISAGTVRISASTGLTSGAPITSRGNIEVSNGTGTASFLGAVSASGAGNITITTGGKTYIESTSIRALGSGSVSITAGPVFDHAVQAFGSTISSTTGSVSISGTSTRTDWVSLYFYSSTTVSSTSGAINLTGTGGNWGAYFIAADVISTSGGIVINGGDKGVFTGDGGTTNIGATSASVSSSAITITGNRHLGGSSATNIKTTGPVVIESIANQYSENTTFSNYTFTGNSSLRIGKATNGRNVTLGGTGAVNIIGDYTLYGAAISQSTSVSSSAGSIGIYGSNATIDANLTATGGTNREIRIKTTGWTKIESSRKLTTSGGNVVIWTASGKVAGTTSINSTIYVNSNASIVTGGGKIWLAGGLDDGGADASITTSRGKWSSVVANDGLPDGYAVGHNNSDAWRIGVFFNSGANTLLNSSGGDIFIAGAQGPTSSSDNGHILLNPGVRIDSGTGRIAMWARALPGSTNWSQGITLNYGNDSNPVMITSNAPTSDAITLYSDSQSGAACSRGITAYWHGVLSGTRGYQGTQILATSPGGGITLTGLGSTSTSCVGGDGWGVDLEYADVLAKSGPITVNGIGNGNGTTPGLSTGWTGNNSSLARFGAWAVSGTGTSGGGTITTPGGVTADFTSSSSDVQFNVSSVYSWQGGYGTVVNTSGSFSILPATVTNGVVSSATNFARAQTADHWQFGRFSTPTRMSSFTLGGPSTASHITYAGTSSILTQGDVAINAGNLILDAGIDTTNGANIVITSRGTYAGSGSLTSAGKVSIDSGATTALNGNVSSGSQGILVKSVGRISSNAGTSAAIPRLFATAGGPITLWTTGATGGVALANWTQLNTTQSGASAGADITIGGGAASTADSNRPAGFATNSGDHGVSLGTSVVASAVVMRSGNGIISISGEYTTQNSSTYSGVKILPGSDLRGGQIVIRGTTQSSSASAGGVETYTATNTPTVIEATQEFTDFTPAIQITASSRGSTSAFIGPPSGTGLTTIRATGEKAGVNITGNTSVTSGTQEGVWLANIIIETKNGRTVIDSGDDDVALGGVSRPFTFRNVSGTPGGDLTIRGNRQSTSVGVTLQTAGIVSMVPSSSSFGASVTFPTSGSTVNVGGLIVGSDANTSALTAGAAVTSTGNITYSGGSFTQASSSATLSASSSGSTIRILADSSIALSGSVRANNNGIVLLEPRVSGTGIRVGGTNPSTMELIATQLETHISATTLRLGDRDRTGNVFINSNLNLTGKAQNLAIRSNSNVNAAAGVVITVANLGIDAEGTIGFPGTGGAATVIALNAGGVTFNQSANYNVAVVDGIDPEFGFATKFVLSNVDRTNTVDRFMAVTFNPPPPAVVIQDKFNNPLASNNQSASSFVVRATLVSVPSDGVVRSLDGATAVRGGATHTFTNLRVMGGTGLVGISYTAERADGTLLADSQTGATSVRINYAIRAGEPASIALTFSSNTTRAGIADLNFTATLKDTLGGTLTSGDYKNATINLTMTGDTGRIVSGGTSSTTDGVARFPDLIVAGNAANNGYTLTFAVTFQNSQGVTTTVSRSQVISITPGTPVALGISSTSQTVATRATLAGIDVKIIDAYGNAAASSFPTAVTVSSSPGVTHSQTPTLTGTRPVDTDASTSVASFTDLKLSGKVDTYTLTFTSGSLTPTTHTVRLTHGAANSLDVSGATTADNDRPFGSAVVVEILDQDQNLVTSGNQSTQSVTISAANATLTGTREVSATGGRATFSSLTMVGLIGPKVLTADSAPSLRGTTTVVLGFGDATRLVISTQASGFVNRVAFSTQPEITAQDSSGNTVTNFGADISVTATRVGGGGSAIITGTLTRTPGSGVATFTNLRLDGTVGQYDLTFGATGVSSTTQRVTLTHGVAAKVVLTGATTASNARTIATNIVAEIQDANDNRVTSGSQSEQQIALTATGATLSGTPSVNASGGIATFSNLTLTATAGTKRLTATISSPSTISGFRDIDLAHGEATQLVLTTSATEVVSRGNFTTQPVVSVRDVSGNPVSDFVGRVTVDVSRAGTSVPFALTGTTGIALNGNATATFSGLGLFGEIGSYTLTFTVSVPSGVASTSQTVNLAHGTAAKIQLVSPPTSARNSVVISDLVVRVLDTDNNIVTSDSSSTISLGITGASLSGYGGSQTVSSGQTTFSGISIVGLTGPKTLTATRSGAGSLTTSSALQLTFGEATKLAITTAATGAVNRQVFTTQPTVVVQDVSGNTVDNYTGSVSVDRSPTGATLTGTRTVGLTGSATATFSGLGLEGSVREYTLTYSSGSLAATSQTIRLTHGAAYSIDVTGPAEANSGADLSAPVVVKVFDQDANLVTTGTESVALSVPVTISGQTTRSVEAGIATFTNLRFTSTTGVKRITAALVGSPSITDFYDIDLKAGLAIQFELVAAPTTSVNRQTFVTQPVIRALDATGNLANSFTGDVSIAVTRIGGGTAAVISGTALRNAVNGQVTFDSLGLVGLVGNYTLTYSSSTAGIATTSHTVALTHGVATQLSLVSGVTSSLSRQQFGADSVIQVLDASGNAVTNFTGEISVAVGGSNITLTGTTTRQLTATSQRNFDDLELFGKIGTYTLTFISGSLTPVTQSVELAHGVAHSLDLQMGTTAKNNQTISAVVVRILDQDLNLVTRENPQVTLTGGALTGTLQRPASGGQVTFDALRFLGVTGDKYVSASIASPSLTSSQVTVRVSAGNATQMVLTTAATAAVNRAGIATVPVVTLKDISGNTVEDSTAVVTVTRSPSDADLSGTDARAASLGVVRFDGLGLNGKVGQYTLTYSTPGLTAITQTIDLTHGAAVKLAIVTSADTSRSGIPFVTQPLVEILDQDNNLVTTGASSVASVTVTRTGSGGNAVLSGDTEVVAVAGRASFANLRLTGDAAGYGLQFSSGSLTVATQNITVLAGLPASIRIVTGTTDRIAGTGFANTVSVELIDGSGNRLLSDSTTDITATLIASSTVATRAVSTTTVRVTSGLAEFTGLNYTLAGDHKIRFTDGTRTTLSSSFTITHAVAAKFAIVSQPTSLRSDIASSVSRQGSAMVVRVLDQYDNPVLSGNAITVTATVTGSNFRDASAVSGDSEQTTLGSEVVSLPDLKLKGKEGNYTVRLTATASGVSFTTNLDPIALTFGTPAKIVITQSAAVARAGSAFGTQPKLEIRDSAENVVSDSTLSVTATVDGRQMVGVNGKAASAGIVTFVGLGIQGTTATDVVIRYATNYNGTPLETTQKIDVTAGLASKLQIIQQPTTVMTRATFSSSTSVRLLDAFDNPVPTDSSSTVSIELLKGQFKDPAFATGGGPVTLASATAVNGVATFTGLTLPVEPGLEYFLKFTIGSFSETSTMFEVLPGVVASLAITQQPLNGTAPNFGKTGDLLAQQPQVTLRDADGYVAKGASGTVSVAISSGIGGSLSSGVTTITISEGIARFNGVRLVGKPKQGSVTAETYRLSFKHTPSGGNEITSPESVDISVKHADAKKLSVEWTNTVGIAGCPFGFEDCSGSKPIVRILDEYNNIVETGEQSVLRIGANTSPNSVLGGTGITAVANGGVATFNLLSIGGKTNTNYPITFSVVGGTGGISSVTKDNVTVTHASAYRTVLKTVPVSNGPEGLTKTGQKLEVTPVVEIQDFYGNVVLNSNLQVSVTLSRVSPNTLEATDRVLNGKMAAINGVASFTNLRIIGKPGSQYVLTFNADGMEAAISDPLVLRHGDPFSIKIATQPSSLDVNGNRIMTGEALYTRTVLHLLDEYGNLATEIGSETSVSAFVFRGGGTAVTGNPAKNTAVFSEGVATFDNLTLIATPGVEQVLKFETSARSRTIVSGESAGVTLTHNVPKRLAVLTQPCAGQISAGVCQAGITGRVMLGAPVIEVQDEYGNRATSFQGTIDVATTTSEATLRDSASQTLERVTVTAVNGVATFTNLRLVALPGTPANLRFTSGDLTAVTSNPVSVLAAEAKRIAMISQPVGARTGSVLAITPVVELRDEFGNRALSDDTSRITVTVSSGTLSGTLTVTASAGRASFTDLAFTAQPNLNYSLTFSSPVGTVNPLQAITSADFTVSNAVASSLVITQEPVAQKTGDLLAPIGVQLLDRFGNPATTDTTTVVRVSIHGGDGNGKFVDGSDVDIANAASSTLLRVVATNGMVTFDTLRIVATPGTQANPGTPYRLIFTANPDSQDPADRYQSAQSAPMVFAHAAPSQLRVVSSPSSLYMEETALADQPVLHLLDRYGNRATSDTQTVVRASIYAGTTGVIRSGTTARAAEGVISFAGLTVGGKPGDLYKLRFTADGTAITVDELTGFRLKKIAAILNFSYGDNNKETTFAPSATVTRNAGQLTDSPGAVSFSTTASRAVCTVDSSNGNITVNGVGSCSVTVTVDNSTYYDKTSSTTTLVINKAPQSALRLTNDTSVTFLSTLPLSSEGGSGEGEVSYLVAQGTCRVAGTTLILGEVGSVCRVAAYKEQDDNYDFISSQLTTISVTPATQAALSIGNDTTIENGGDVKLFTYGGSGSGQVSYEVDPSYTPGSGFSNAACSVISGDVLRASANGKCRIRAIKAASKNFIEAPSSLKVFTFSKAKQTVSFTSPALDRPVTGDIFEPLATSSADNGPTGLPISYSITQGSGTTCRFDAVQTSKVRFLSSGLCEITATQGGNDKYISASVSMSIQVGLRTQTITFGALAPRVFGEPAFLLTGTASSGLSVIYQVIAPVSDQACRVTPSGLVTIQSAGTCGITATQPGNGEFSPAPTVTQILTINPDRAGAPHLISVSASDQTITAHFTTPSYLGGVSSVLRYRLEATLDGTDDTYVNWACPVTTPLEPCQISGLPLDAGQTYTVQVAAVTAAGVGAYSRPANGIKASKATSAVSNLIATSTSTQLELEWDAPRYIDGNFLAYEVYVWPLNQVDAPDSPTAFLDNVSDQSVSIEIEQPDESPSLFSMFSFRSFSAPATIPQSGAYNIKVVTITDKNASLVDDRTARGVKIGFTTPGAPQDARLTSVDNKLAFGWSAPTYDGGHPVLGYIVMLNGEPACRTVPAGAQEVCEDSTSRLLEVSNLKAGTTYQLQVAAVNQLGIGEMFLRTHSVPAPVVNAPSSSTVPPGLLPTKPVPPKKPGEPDKKPGLPPPPAASEEPAEPEAPVEPAPPATPSDPGAAPSDPGVTPGIGATGDDNAPPVPFDPLSSPEGVAALTDSLGNAAAAVGAIAAAAAAAAAAAGAAGAAAGGGSSGGSGSSGSGGQGNQGGSIATIDAAHERFTNRRRGRGDKWKIWKNKWLSFSDKFSIATVIKSAKFSPLFSKIAVDGAYLRAAFGSLGLLPTIAAAAISVMTVSMNEGAVLTPQWQWFIVLAVIGIFDAFAGLVGTLIFVAGTVVMHGGVSSMDDVRLLLGVIIVGYGPALLANAFRAFRKEPEEGEEYWWERLVDLVVLPFIGGWVTATMISILPALAGTTMAVANHVNDFAIAIAIAITLRVVFEEFVGRWFPARLDTLHPTDVDDPKPYQKWISVSFRLGVFVFVTAALMGNVWQVWVGSALFILPTIIGFYSHKFRNFPWIWRIMPTGIPGLAFALIVASVTTSIVNGWFGATPDLALWSFALLPIPMLGIAILAMIGREGNEGEVRWIKKPGFKWGYRIGGIFMLLATMELAGVLDIFPF